MAENKATDYAKETIYLFLGTCPNNVPNITGWTLALLVWAFQLGLLAQLVKEASPDGAAFSNGYEPSCGAPSYSDGNATLTCEKIAGRVGLGGIFWWFATMVVLLSFTVGDVVAGIKIIIFKSLQTKLIGVVLVITQFVAIFATLYYVDGAIEKPVDALMNVAVLLFILDIDERMYDLVNKLCPECIANMKDEVDQEEPVQSEDEAEE